MVGILFYYPEHPSHHCNSAKILTCCIEVSILLGKKIKKIEPVSFCTTKDHQWGPFYKQIWDIALRQKIHFKGVQEPFKPFLVTAFSISSKGETIS